MNDQSEQAHPNLRMIVIAIIAPPEYPSLFSEVGPPDVNLHLLFLGILEDQILKEKP